MKKNICLLIFILIVIFITLPLISLIVMGSRGEDWIFVLKSQRFYEGLVNTILIGSLTVIIDIIIGTPISSIVARENFRMKKFIEMLIVLPLIIPGFIMVMGIQYNFIKFGLIDGILGVTLIHSVVTLPYYIISMRVAYSTLSRDYNRLGKIMGASDFQIFRKITLPIIFPGFLGGISMVLIVSFNQYLTTLIIGGGEVITLPILMFPYLSGGDIKVGGVYSILYILINLFLVVFLEKSLEKVYYKKGLKNDKN